MKGKERNESLKGKEISKSENHRTGGTPHIPKQHWFYISTTFLSRVPKQPSYYMSTTFPLHFYYVSTTTRKSTRTLRPLHFYYAPLSLLLSTTTLPFLHLYYVSITEMKEKEKGTRVMKRTGN